MSYKLLSSLYYSDKTLYEETYLRRFNSESTYRFNFKIHNNNAFVVINNDLLSKLDAILSLDKKLLYAMNSVPPIALYQYEKKCLIDEIKMTNDIEGVNSTRKEITEILNDKGSKNKHKRLYGIVRKYQMLMQEEDIKLEKCEDIRNLYNEFTLEDIINENPEHMPDGDIFRKDKVYINDKHQKIIHSGVFPESAIIDSMSSCLDILNNDSYNFLIRIAVFHYAFGYIHPFYDGNGRTSRFVSSYLICKKLEHLVAYKLSYTIKENINTYYKSFNLSNDEKNKGDLTMFVSTFFDFIIKSIDDLITSLEDRRDKLNFYNEIINNIFVSDIKIYRIAFVLIQNTLFGESGMSINTLHEISDVGVSKVRQIIKHLDEIGILVSSKEGNRFIYNINLSNLEKLGE